MTTEVQTKPGAYFAIPKSTRWRHPTAFSCWGDEEREAIERVIDSGQFTMGPEVEAFEREFAMHHGMRHGIMVNSGSSANLIAVAALFYVKDRPVRRGARVLVPAIAWATTYAPLVQHGLELKLVDCDDSWNAVPQLKSDDDPAIIVGCSVLGSPAFLDGWRRIAEVSGAWFLEDNCESLGASINGRLCGTFGDLNTFSFFWSHQLGAIDGGMILTGDYNLARLCRMLRDHGATRTVQPAASFDGEYDFRLFGYNVRPLEMHAAIARAQLRKLPQFVAARQANLEAFRRATVGLPLDIPAQRGKPSPFGLPFALRSPEARDGVVKALRAAGIDCRLPTGGSFTKHAYGATWRDQETPRADFVHCAGLFLGNGPFDMTAQIAEVVEVLKRVL